ncbi:hypothetical protein C2G38_2028592 [Gigaspora rosea]|uniref:Centrosomal protein CEP104 Zn finger domain-containing protein n=1 Tax=Gigaspora rosea TaxID=44941 RepID=A0A397W0Z3_9GLOM|nr:hypothetical protein C2G38_2028592 [Gigaspora rosea]
MSSRRDSTEEQNVPRETPSKSTDATLCERLEEYVPIEEPNGGGICIFCEEYNEKFTEENLITHYWKECPILTKCRLCNIILEISTLDDHMLFDCDKCQFVKQCSICHEVVDTDDYLAHINKKTCIAINDDKVSCPLCRGVIKPANEYGWNLHLLGANGCPKNSRKPNNKPDVFQ